MQKHQLIMHFTLFFSQWNQVGPKSQVQKVAQMVRKGFHNFHCVILNLDLPFYMQPSACTSFCFIARWFSQFVECFFQILWLSLLPWHWIQLFPTTQMFCLMLFWSIMEMGRNPIFPFLHLHMRKSCFVLFQLLSESCTCKIWSYHFNPIPCHRSCSKTANYIADCWNSFALSLCCFLFLSAGTTPAQGSL